MNANIAARLSELVQAHPDRTAIVESRGGHTRRVTFAELDERARAFAADWRRRGVREGDRLLVFVPMSITLYAVLMAAFRLGAVAVFVDAWADRRRLEAAIERTRPRAFIGIWKAHLLRLTSRAVRGIPIAIAIGDRAPGSRPGSDDLAVLEPHHAALVTFTTGSTGRPKAAERSHGFLWNQHLALKQHLQPREGDVDMPTLPVFVLNNLASGVPSVLPDFDPRRPADIDPAEIISQMRRERVTTSSGSPAFYERLARHCARRAETLPLRALHTGGAPVLPALASALAAIVPHAHVVYGSTEAEPIAAIEANELVAAMAAPGTTGLCVGRPVPSLECWLVCPHDEPIDPGSAMWREAGRPTGVVGEVIVSGPHVLPGYLEDPEGTRANKILAGGRVWHRTGDAACLDAAGRLWLMGRVRERVVRQGRTWWPLPVELRALQFEGVMHAAYLGIPDSALGQRAVLCVELSAGARVPDVTSLRKIVDAPIDELRVFDRLPRDPRHASKTDLLELRRQLAHR